MRRQRRSRKASISISDRLGRENGLPPFSLERTRNDPRSNPRSNRRNRSLWRVLCHAFEFRVSYPITRTISCNRPGVTSGPFCVRRWRFPPFPWRVTGVVGATGTYPPARHECRWRPVSGPLNRIPLICPELSLFLSFGRVHVVGQSPAERPIRSCGMANSFGALPISKLGLSFKTPLVPKL